MRNILTKIIAGAALATAAVAAVPAQAQHWGGGHGDSGYHGGGSGRGGGYRGGGWRGGGGYYGGRGWGGGRYYGGYYGPAYYGYYGPGYYDDPAIGALFGLGIGAAIASDGYYGY